MSATISPQYLRRSGARIQSSSLNSERTAIFDIMSTMASEIRQQPAAIEKTLKAEWRKAVKLREYFAQHPVRLIILAARGTSDNAAQFGRYLIEISTGIPVSLAAPSVFTLYGGKMNLQGCGRCRDFAIGRIHRHQYRSGKGQSQRRLYCRYHERGGEHASETGRACVLWSGPAKNAACGHQDLYRPASLLLPAGLRARRTA